MSDAKAKATGRCDKCHGLLWADDPRVLHACSATPPRRPPTVKELPCVFRGSPMGKVRRPGCDCPAVVYGCSKADSNLCVLMLIEGATLLGKVPAVCAGCSDRQEPPATRDAAAGV